jgi:hypothetical protein
MGSAAVLLDCGSGAARAEGRKQRKRARWWGPGVRALAAAASCSWWRPRGGSALGRLGRPPALGLSAAGHRYCRLGGLGPGAAAWFGIAAAVAAAWSLGGRLRTPGYGDDGECQGAPELLWVRPARMSLTRAGVIGSAVIAPGIPMASSTADAIAAPTPVMPLSPAPLMPSGLRSVG